MKKHLIFPLLFLTLLSSCGVLPKISCTNAKKIHVGMSQDQVITALGEPYFVSISRDVTILGWQDNENYQLSRETLRVNINPVTKLVRKVEGTCAQ